MIFSKFFLEEKALICQSIPLQEIQTTIDSFFEGNLKM